MPVFANKTTRQTQTSLLVRRSNM